MAVNLSIKNVPEALAAARQAWLREMEDFKIGPGMVGMDPAVALRPEHVENCTVIVDRLRMTFSSVSGRED